MSRIEGLSAAGEDLLDIQMRVNTRLGLEPGRHRYPGDAAFDFDRSSGHGDWTELVDGQCFVYPYSRSGMVCRRVVGTAREGYVVIWMIDQICEPPMDHTVPR